MYLLVYPFIYLRIFGGFQVWANNLHAGFYVDLSFQFFWLSTKSVIIHSELFSSCKNENFYTLNNSPFPLSLAITIVLYFVSERYLI